MTTRGVTTLRDRGIAHEVLTYRYREMGARVAADALGLSHDIVLKSLVFGADDGTFLFVLVSGNALVSTRKVGRLTGHKHIEAASSRNAERVTGYRVGGISPLGARRRLHVLLDEQTAAHPRLVINAGARGTLVRLATADLIRLTDAALGDVQTG